MTDPPPSPSNGPSTPRRSTPWPLELFGKRILFTDHDDWAVVDVVAGYRSQSDVENDFRQMKDPHVVSFSPMFHWTDNNIRVHAFYCVLALTVARLMRREAANAGMPMSVRELLDTLAGIQETVLLYPSTGGRPKARRMLTETDPTQQRLYDLFGLDAYAPAPMTTTASSPRHGPRSKPPCERAARPSSPITATNASFAPTPSAGRTAGPCCSATRPADRPAPERSPPIPDNGGAASTSTKSTPSSPPTSQLLGHRRQLQPHPPLPRHRRSHHRHHP